MVVIPVFSFLHEQRIVGDEGVDLLLEAERPADEEKGYVPSYEYAIVLHGTDQKIGGICLRIGDNENTYYGGHIGYGVDEGYRGHGYATKACRLLRDLAVEHGVKELLITCNPENTASRRTCENLGADLVGELLLPEHNEMYQEGERRKLQFRWTL